MKNLILNLLFLHAILFLNYLKYSIFQLSRLNNVIFLIKTNFLDTRIISESHSYIKYQPILKNILHLPYFYLSLAIIHLKATPPYKNTVSHSNYLEYTQPRPYLPKNLSNLHFNCPPNLNFSNRKKNQKKNQKT
jgi:hypothetical protein